MDNLAHLICASLKNYLCYASIRPKYNFIIIIFLHPVKKKKSTIFSSLTIELQIWIQIFPSTSEELMAFPF